MKVFIALYILSVPANTAGIKTMETREIQIGLKRDGNLSDTENIPQCGSDQTIQLMSYNYHQLQCHFAEDCSSTHAEPLLPEEVFHLHHMCSMQQRCRNLTFFHRTEAQRNKTNAIIIRYKCIDQNRLVNICEKNEMTFSDSVYLTSSDIKESFKECQCFVNSGRFTISIIDIRLNNNMNSNCSPATLHVNDKEFLCDGRRNDYGAVFSKSLRDPLSNAYISLVQKSKTTFPDIVLIELQPEISLKLICRGQQATRNINVSKSSSVGRSNDTPKRPITTAVLAIDDVTKSVILPETTCPQHNRTTPATLIVSILTLFTVLVILTVTVLKYVSEQRRKQFKSKPSIEAGSFDSAEMTPLIKSNSVSVETQTLLEQPLAKIEAESQTDSAYISLADKRFPSAKDNKNRGSTLPYKNKFLRPIAAEPI